MRQERLPARFPFDKVEGKTGWDHLAAVWRQMQSTIAEGLKADGVLPGGLNLPRKAKSFYRQSLKLDEVLGQTALLAAYACEGKGRSLEAFLNEEVFGSVKRVTVKPDPETVKGFAAYSERFEKALTAERTAVENC